MKDAINIYSNVRGLGGALTNPTGISRHKGNIRNSYPVTIADKKYPDAERAYQDLKGDLDPKYWERLSAWIIAHKLVQHQCLFDAIGKNGGTKWLETCKHQAPVKSSLPHDWCGIGKKSKFIRSLIAGYLKAKVIFDERSSK